MSNFEESNFYKSLQDFFNNNNKDTFLQFLAEFYNRTESIIDKNIIQDELIKELRELYIEFNEKGIDENIVREKVDYFVENNGKIKDILAKLVINTNKIEDVNTKLNANTNNIENITSQLETATNNIENISSQLDTNENNVKYVSRRFKPLIKFSPEFVRSNSDNNYLTVYSDDDIKAKIQKIAKFNIDGLIWIAHVTVRNGYVEVYENIEKFKFAINEARKYGLEFTAIKFHSVEDEYIQQIGVDKFFTEYKQIINDFINVPNNNIEHITVCNESSATYYNTIYKTYFTNIMNFVKSLGYKTGVTLTANDSDKSSDDNNAWIFDLSTNIYCNWYPSISNKLKKTTKTDCINGVNSSFRRPLTPKETYNKPVIASECGVKNGWENLTNPADWKINGENSNGVVPRLYWYGIFESDAYKHFDEIWVWYDKYLYNDETIKLFDYYLGGEK